MGPAFRSGSRPAANLIAMAPSAQHRGCLICGSPDLACGGHDPATKIALIERPQAPEQYTGPIVTALRPGPSGPYRARAREDEALDKGWEVLEGGTHIEELGGGWFRLPDGTKVQGEAKARSALNKARGPGGIK